MILSAFQPSRSSVRTATRPRSPPLPALLKNAPSTPQARTASQRPTRAPAPSLPPKVEPPKSRAAAKSPLPTPVTKATAKSPAASRSSRVGEKFHNSRPKSRHKVQISALDQLTNTV